MIRATEWAGQKGLPEANSPKTIWIISLIPAKWLFQFPNYLVLRVRNMDLHHQNQIETYWFNCFRNRLLRPAGYISCRLFETTTENWLTGQAAVGRFSQPQKNYRDKDIR